MRKIPYFTQLGDPIPQFLLATQQLRSGLCMRFYFPISIPCIRLSAIRASPYCRAKRPPHVAKVCTKAGGFRFQLSQVILGKWADRSWRPPQPTPNKGHCATVSNMPREKGFLSWEIRPIPSQVFGSLAVEHIRSWARLDTLATKYATH